MRKLMLQSKVTGVLVSSKSQAALPSYLTSRFPFCQAKTRWIVKISQPKMKRAKIDSQTAEEQSTYTLVVAEVFWKLLFFFSFLLYHLVTSFHEPSHRIFKVWSHREERDIVTDNNSFNFMKEIKYWAVATKMRENCTLWLKLAEQKLSALIRKFQLTVKWLSFHSP